jgi:hypothetical protein
VVDCVGGKITSYDTLLQLDHNTNATLVGGQPNRGFAVDPGCTATFTGLGGATESSCIEPAFTFAPTATTGPGTPTPTPRPTATAKNPAASICSGDLHAHPNVCNSPVVQTFSGSSPAGGFRLRETIALSFAIGEDCSTPCPADDTPVTGDDLALAGEITSGQTRGVIWNLNNTASIMGTTGVGNGSNICGIPVGGPVCRTVASGAGFDLSSVGGSCVSGVPPTASGASVALAYPALDFPTIGDFIATLTLECQ